MEFTHTQKFLKSTPRKLRGVVALIKDMTPSEAIIALPMVRKRAAGTLLKTIKTAVANAQKNGAEGKEILFKEIQVNEGPRMKRWRAGAKGRAKPYKKRMSHLRIVLETKDEKPVKKKMVKKGKKK